jgi:hypothetical protein
VDESARVIAENGLIKISKHDGEINPKVVSSAPLALHDSFKVDSFTSTVLRINP